MNSRTASSAKLKPLAYDTKALRTYVVIITGEEHEQTASISKPARR